MSEKDNIETLKEILKSDGLKAYATYYILHTGKRLETIEDLIDAILDDEFTWEDVFYERMNHLGMDYDTERYWEDNMEKFSFENYFATDEKSVGDGHWIKVRTEKGYEVHWAKRSVRKPRFMEKLEAINRKMRNPKITAEGMKPMLAEIDEIKMRHLIGMRPYEVYYYRTRTQKRYLLPYQYELANIDDHVSYIMDNVPTVKVRKLFTAKNNDQIFYLRSRGIPENLAIVMSNLKQCYFVVDMEESIKLYNEHTNRIFRKQLQVQ